MLPGTCNCDPFARTKGSFCRNFHEQSSFFDGFSASHSCSFHTSGYLVPNCRPFPYFFDNRVGYLCGIDCTSSWRGLDEWNEGERLDRQKRRVAPLEPGKVIINEFQNNSQPTYAIHSRKDYNTQKTPYLRSRMSDTSGERRWRTQVKLELGYWYIPSRERRQTGKKADHIGGANRKTQLFGADQSSVPPPLTLSLSCGKREELSQSWRRLYLRKSAKLRFRYVLYPFDRVRTSFPSLPFVWQK